MRPARSECSPIDECHVAEASEDRIKRSWKPILHGRERDEALAIVRMISEEAWFALRQNCSNSVRSSFARNASLAFGAAGGALLHAYLALCDPSPSRDYATRSAELLGMAVENARSGVFGPGLFEGAAGVGWVAEHLRERLPGLFSGDPNYEVDEVLAGILGSTPSNLGYDLVSGVVGLGVYGLERAPVGAGLGICQRALETLERMAHETQHGTTWWTDPIWLHPTLRRRWPNGYVDLGVAHGVAGIIALLGSLYGAGIRPERTRRLTGAAVRWIVAQQLPPGKGGYFTSILADNSERRPARLAWCYGDLGIAAAILLAARAFGQQRWEEKAVSIACGAASRAHSQSGVRDASLCHGAAGAGHLFNRLYQFTGEEALRTAAINWFVRALDLREAGRGIAGYQVLDSDTVGGDLQWVSDPGFLCGASGIALTLLAAATSTEPQWDSVLLLSTRSPRSCLSR